MLYCRERVKKNETGKEGKEMQGMLAKLATRKHTLVPCIVGSFLGRLLGNTLPRDSPPSVGRGLVYWLLPVFVSLSLANVCSMGSSSPTLLGCVTQPLWESAETSNPLLHSIKLSLGPDVVGGTRISTAWLSWACA